MNKSLIASAIAVALCSASGAALSQGSQTQQPGAATNAGSAPVISVQPNYSDAMRRLLDAAQRFRDATHAMAAMHPGEDRTNAIRAADKALRDTQDAMVQLPPELRNAGAGAGASGEAAAMQRLQQASDDVRQFVQALADEPAGPRRDQAIKDANRALLEAQQAMIDLPPQARAAR